MTTFDGPTLFIVAGLVVIVTGICFLLETFLRRNDAVGRLWSVFFLGTMLTVFSYVVVSFVGENWWAGAVGNGAYVAAIGFLWSGARRANGRSALTAVPLLTGFAVIGAGLIPGPTGGFWAGSVEMFLGVAAMGVLCAIEFARGALARLLAARVIAGLTALTAVYYITRAVLLPTLGPEHEVFVAYFGTATSTFVEIAFVIVGTIMLTSIQNDRFSSIDEKDVEIGARLRIEGIMPAATFRQLAETWLMRSIRERATLVLLVIEVADLTAINTAFGRAAGDAAIRTAGRITVTHAPTATIVGHLSPRRFGLLLEVPVDDTVEAIADRISDAVLGARIDDQDRFRATTVRGIATTRTNGARYDDLVDAAVEAARVDAQLARERSAASGILSQL